MDSQTENNKREYSDARCTCDEREIGRTLAKGTPAEKHYCGNCGGYIP